MPTALGREEEQYPNEKKAWVFFCAAGSDYSDIFCGALATIKHFFNTINAEFDINESVLLRNCDYMDAIPSDILENCRMLGQKYFTEKNI